VVTPRTLEAGPDVGADDERERVCRRRPPIGEAGSEGRERRSCARDYLVHAVVPDAAARDRRVRRLKRDAGVAQTLTRLAMRTPSPTS